MLEKIKTLVTLADQHGSLKDQYEKAVRAHVDQCNALDGEEFWPLVDALSSEIVLNLKRSRTVKHAIDEFVRSRLFDQRKNAEQMLATWQTIAEFARAYRKVKVGLTRATQDWPDLDMSDDTFGDFVDSMVLGGKTKCQLICSGEITTRHMLGVNLFTHALEHFILFNNENYIESTIIEVLGEKLPSIARDFRDPRVEKVEKDPPSAVLRDMDLEAVAATLALILEKTTRPFPGHVQINLTTDEHAALTKVVHMFQLADLVNYKRAQDSFPRLLNAVKLVLAIADHPELNPTEKISLATKTRAQLDSAVKFAEKL